MLREQRVARELRRALGEQLAQLGGLDADVAHHDHDGAPVVLYANQPAAHRLLREPEQPLARVEEVARVVEGMEADDVCVHGAEQQLLACAARASERARRAPPPPPPPG